ncbi:MAG: DNA polymerase Y family protein, partial [Alphaproteobacteria bacterium]|nr:DNA polymerase Y family protein [Alphaproteobacteria bacterium]
MARASGASAAPDRVAPESAADELVLAAPEGGAVRLAAVTLAASRAGLFPGQTLADARALAPDVAVLDHDPEGDMTALDALADWCGRYTPWTAASGLEPGGAAGIWLDVSGCAHLFGGEDAMLDDLTGRLSRVGYAARAGLADTTGAAWAAARFGKPARSRNIVVPPGRHTETLARMPVAALRLPPDMLDSLERLGLRRISDIAGLPRAGLARRFGELPGRRLDQAFGRRDEPISPRAPAPVWRLRTAFPEALGREEDIAAAVRNLAEALCNRMARAEQGARRLELCLYRVGGRVDTVEAGTSRASRDPDHLMRLLREHLDRLPEPPSSAPDALSAAAEAMVETLTLAATVAEPLRMAQTGLTGNRNSDPAELERLVDRLSGRLGADNVRRFDARDTHLPERVQTSTPALSGRTNADGGKWQASQPRPPRLLSRPEEIEAVAPVPDDPPVMFRWRGQLHQVTRAEGPERIAPEWWRNPAPGTGTAVLDDETRDYYRVEDETGRRFWLYRAGLYDHDRPADRPPR